MGNNHHGNLNEHSFVDALNNTYIRCLNLNLKNFIRYICKSKGIDFREDLKINANYESNTKLKQDFYLHIANRIFAISLKMGTGNSTHQEKIDDFINYIKEDFNAPDIVCNNIKLFIWADGTFDGKGALSKDSKGNIISRISTRDFKKKYPEQLAIINKFFSDNSQKIIRHTLFEGRHNSTVDFIYHGTILNGSWISSDELIEFQLKNPKNACTVPLGRMSMQPWNISKMGNTEYKRGQIQVKYSSMKKDFGILMDKTNDTGTFSGDRQEFELSNILNKNKNHKFWDILLPNEKNYENFFIVKVQARPYSKLSNKKVFPKSDAYIINHKLDRQFLLKNEYTLTEGMIPKCVSYAVENTGISIKLKTSNNYTIHKFTHNSFLKAFNKYLDKPLYHLAGLLIYSNKNELFKNKFILKNLDINESNFFRYFHNIGISSLLNIDDLKLIRKTCQQHIKHTINADIKLKSAIFTGQYWFNSPYYTSFMYKNDNITNELFEDFYITTGSGRSKGNYTIEIKPL